MNVLLAIDYSPCAHAAVEAVRDGLPRGTTVRVVHVVEWPHDAPVSLTFAQGRRAAECVLAPTRRFAPARTPWSHWQLIDFPRRVSTPRLVSRKGARATRFFAFRRRGQPT